MACLALLPATHCFADPAGGRRHYEVYPGSAFKLAQMLDRSQWPYVAAHADAFYYHPVGFRELSDAQKRLLVDSFKTRNAIVEGDMKSGNAAGDVASLNTLLALGLKPTAAIDNEVPPDPANWALRIANNKRLGASTLLMLAPHVFYRVGWSDPKEDYARVLINTPGCTGSGVDAPTYLFLHWGASYQQAIFDQRNYTAAHGKKFMYVLSPNNSNANFLPDSEQVVRLLEDNNAEPDSYAVELYGKRPIELTPESVAGTGLDRPAASSILGVAYYLLKHRDGIPGTLSLRVTAASPLAATVLLANSSPWLDYAPVLKATVSNQSQGWRVRFFVGQQDITDTVRGDGFLFYKTQRLLPGTRQSVQIRLQRGPGASARKPVVTLTLLPHDGSAPISTLTWNATSHP